MKESSSSRSNLLIGAALGLLSSSTALSHDAASDKQRLGKVEFKVECNAAAQADFNLAMAYYHSFAWGRAIEEPLERVLKADPGCGMAHWARALALLDNPFAWPGNVSAKVLADGAQALQAA